MSGCTVGSNMLLWGLAVTLSASTAYLVVSYEVGSDKVPRLGVPTFNSQLKISK